jgi:nitrosocyanin
MKTQFAAAAAVLACASSAAPAAEHSIQAATVEASGVKFWVPSTIVVRKGDKVKISAAIRTPEAAGPHGFAIDAFKVQEVVDAKGKSIEFVADKAGIFPLRCHLHPAHIGGQLVVLD